MKKSIAIALTFAFLPLLSACGKPAQATTTSGSSNTPLSYLPATGYEYTYMQGTTLFTETYTKGTPDFSHIPEDAKWLAQLKGTWLKDTDYNRTSNPPQTYENWMFDNGTYDVMADNTFNAVSTLLEYPIAMNKTWKNTVGAGNEATHVIAGVGLQVTTPAGTFKNVVEVKRTYTTGYTVYDYMAPNVGDIKMVGNMPNSSPQTIILTSVKKTS